MNKKILLTSVMSIAMLTGVATGATYALFTAEDSVNIAVNSAKVSLKANVLPEFAYRSLGEAEYKASTDGKAIFATGGVAEVGEDGNIKLDRIVPGDEVEMTVRIENESTVDISYRFYSVVDGELANALVYTNMHSQETSQWTKWGQNEANRTKDIKFNVRLPKEVGNDFQEKNCNIQIVVEAVQGNAGNVVLLNGTKADSLDAAVAAAKAGDLIEISGSHTLQGPEGVSKTLDLKGVTIEGMTEYTTLSFVNFENSNSTGTCHFANLNLKDLTVIDETFYSSENGENAWEFTYLEFAGNNNFTNVKFTDGIMLDDVNGTSTFTNCTFVGHNNDSSTLGNVTMYGAWVYSGNATFTNCEFTGTRGLKVADQYADSDVKEVLVDGCKFGPLSEKPGIAVDNRKGSLLLTIKNSTFTGTKAGDLGNYIYEDDKRTPATTTIVLENNTVNALIEKTTNLSELFGKIQAGSTVELALSAGTYTLPSNNSSANIVISGTKNTVVDFCLGAYMVNATLTLKGVTIKGSLGYANGNGSDYAALYSHNVTYNDCHFNGGFRVGRDGAKFVNCTFDLTAKSATGVNYVWTYGNDVTFEGCTFNTDGKAILVYSDGVGSDGISSVKVSGCTFNANVGAKAGAIANQNCAAIEVDNFGNGANVVTENNIVDEEFSGEWRIKSFYSGKKSVTINGKTYTSLALDGKLMTIDANKNVTVQG